MEKRTFLGDNIPQSHILALTRKLVSIPSETGNEKELAHYIAVLLERETKDVDIEFQHVPNVGPNLIAKRFTDDRKKTILLNAHMDTVSASGWTRPYRCWMENGRLRGLGVADMKSGLAICIDVFRTAVKRTRLNLIFTAVSGEEGISNGSYYLISEKNISGDLCLLPEPSCERVMLGCRGRYALDITVHGRAAHGARPELGVNAIVEASKIIANLSMLKLHRHPVLGRGSVTPLGIEASVSSLTLPDKCRFVLDRHYVLSETKETIIADFQSFIKKLQLEGRVEIGLMKRETPYLEPYLTDRKDPMVRSFLICVRKMLPKMKIMFGRSVGDYNRFSKLMPTIVFGPTGGGWHTPMEWVEPNSIIRCRQIYLEFLRTLT